jgi:parvulin-like peptidyl-prolyl isomerase
MGDFLGADCRPVAMVRPLKTKGDHCKEYRRLRRLCGAAFLVAFLWVVLAPAAQAVKLAELDGLNYSSDEYLAALESLPVDSYRRVLASEKDARNAHKASLLEKYLAQQARQQGLDKLPLVESALALVREEALIDWHVHSTGAHDVVARARRIAEETFRKPTDGPAEYRLQQAFVSREEPNAQALITSISNDLENNPSQRSFAQVLSRYLRDVGKAAATGQGHITSADFDMGWHEPADIELRFRPFIESSAAGDIFGPLRLESGWIFLSVVDKRSKAASGVDAVQMTSMRRERRVREAVVAELLNTRSEIEIAKDAPIETIPSARLTTTAASSLSVAVFEPLLQQMGGLFQELGSSASDADYSKRADDSILPDETGTILQDLGLADEFTGDPTKAWQQRREQHRVVAQHAWDSLGDERPAALLARTSASQDRFLSRLQLRALATAQVLQRQATDEELDRIYQENIDRFYLPAQVNLRQIFLAAAEFSQNDVEAVHDQVQLNPQSFNAIAVRVNPGESNLGADGMGKPIAFEELNPIVFKAILSLEIGKVSAPIRSSFGAHIIVLDRFTPAAVKPRDDVENDLIELHRDEMVLAQERQITAALKQRVVVF